MPGKTKSAEDSAVSGLEPKTEINLIRGFKSMKRLTACLYLTATERTANGKVTV